MSGINNIGAFSAQELVVLTRSVEDDWTSIDVAPIQHVATHSFNLLEASREAVAEDYVNSIVDREEYVMVNKADDIDQDPEQLGDDSDWETNMETEIEGLLGRTVDELDYEFVPMQDSEGALELI